MDVVRFITVDPEGREIRLTEAWYVDHILVEHPDLTDDQEIEETIRRAELIAVDAIDELRLVYYRTYRRTPQRWLLKVVVAYNEVVTAYRVNRVKQGERIIWQC
jgi:hypothetical protein